MGTMEPVNAKDFIEQMNLKDSLVWMAKLTITKYIYSQKSRTSVKTEIEIARVNIRPRKLYFFARSWMRRNSHVQFWSRDGIPKQPSTITPKELDSVNNIEEE